MKKLYILFCAIFISCTDNNRFYISKEFIDKSLTICAINEGVDKIYGYNKNYKILCNNKAILITNDVKYKSDISSEYDIEKIFLTNQDISVCNEKCINNLGINEMSIESSCINYGKGRLSHHCVLIKEQKNCICNNQLFFESLTKRDCTEKCINY